MGGTGIAQGDPGMGMDIKSGEDRLWADLVAHQGKTFHTAKNLEFTYTIRGGEMFVDRRSKSITRATIGKAYRRVMEDTEHKIQGPKALNCFGAPYVWSLFAALGIVEPVQRKKKKLPGEGEAGA